LARLSFVIEVEPFNLKKYDKAAIELELRAAAQSWIDDLRALAYTKMDDDQKAYDLIEKYQDAFSADYQNNVNSNQAFEDISHIEKTLKTEQLGINLIRQKSDCQTKGDICHLDLKFYNLEKSLDLSALFPIIENMGFYVTAEIPSKVRLPSGDIVWVQHFVLKTNGVVLKDSDFQNRKHLFEKCFLAVQRGAIEDDTLNQLTLKEGVSGRDILILRTVLRYLRQTIYTYSKTFTEQVVTHNSKIARLLIESFHASHNPTFKGSRKSAHQRIDAELKHEFDNIKSIDHDNIMRLFKNIIDATLRTNFYQTAFDGSIKDYVSIKLDSAQITSLPDPKPYREIFVYAPETEGVHLRGDAIARGGLRWSDRHEDFRTEVLGLMKAQMVKNAVIVPMGSKGGFVVKNPPTTGGRDAWIAEGIRCYKTFIRGLLDITDNVIDNKIVPPKNVVRLDKDDPYLVVAADKGTATFSDIANSVSEEYGFWLGDAFASGGSAGYDHKVMGITARGAWESVKRHFHELDHNSQTQDFDVMGVGDMGGDVFGNGMLLSKHIRLVGAFNHLHIFCDPTPNSKKTWVERKRLFDGVMGWDQYNTKLLSTGGRIYSRQDKVLKLTKQIKQRFGLDKDEVSPNELMTAILKSQTDLIWFGGIGTYIKSKDENHADASDKANDAIRINACQLNARVVGEGANLGVTQEARIEFANLGGKINADFIDNAGGVNSSDVEVNIKILLNKMTKGKKPALTVSARNKLLESMTTDVENLVLKNSYQQAQAVSLMTFNAPTTLLGHAEYIRSLEQRNLLDRDLEFLPSDEEIEERLRDGDGLNRPELSVLQCYAKNTLTKDILNSRVPDHALTEELLLAYFPDVLVKKYKKDILNHQLRREIIATELANIVMNRFGPTFINTIQTNTGADINTIFKAFLVVTFSFDLRNLWDKIEMLDGKVHTSIQMKALSEISRTTERQVIWLIKRMGDKIDPIKHLPIFKKAVQSLKQDLETLLPETRLARFHEIVDIYTDQKVPKDIAIDMASLIPMSAIGNIFMISLQKNIPIRDMAYVYYVIGEHFQLYWLRLQSRHLFASGVWSGQALREIRGQLYVSQAKSAERYISDFKGKKVKISPKHITEWCQKEGLRTDKVLTTIEAMRGSEKIDLSMLIVAEQMLSGLYD
jgi:glutamate dehydrogenase